MCIQIDCVTTYMYLCVRGAGQGEGGSLDRGYFW